MMNSIAHTKSDIKGRDFAALEIFNKLEWLHYKLTW